MTAKLKKQSVMTADTWSVPARRHSIDQLYKAGTAKIRKPTRPNSARSHKAVEWIAADPLAVMIFKLTNAPSPPPRIGCEANIFQADSVTIVPQ